MTNEAEQAPQTPAQAPTPPLRLRRLKINRWRNVLPGTELRFGDGIHALLGKNGTGKTTLLRLISMCVRGDFSGFEGERFDIEYELALGALRLVLSIASAGESRLEQGTFPWASPAPMRSGAIEKNPDYAVTATLELAGQTPVVVRATSESVTIDDGAPQRSRSGSPFSPLFLSGLLLVLLAHQKRDSQGREHERGWSPRLLFPGLIGWVEMCRFDEADGMLRALDGTHNVGNVDIPPLAINLFGDAPRFVNGVWIPRDVSRFLASFRIEEGNPFQEIVLTQESFPTLKEFARLAGFQAMTMSIPFKEKARLDRADLYRYGNARFFVKLRSGDIISHNELSFGQRRLLGFLYYCACNPEILIVDELTNGLHHEWIAHCMDELAKRQSFVATQHPLLLDYLPIESAKDAETAFLQCRLVEQDGEQFMGWRNTSPEEAERFWKSYGSGVQFISEILRTDGLW